MTTVPSKHCTVQYPLLVVHRTFCFGRISGRVSAEPFGSAESCFNFFSRNEIRPNRNSNFKNRIVRPKHAISAETLPKLYRNCTEPFDFQFFLILARRVDANTRFAKRRHATHKQMIFSIICGQYFELFWK